MPMVAEVLPGCLRVSLFLFFVRLGDSLFSMNTTVGISTVVPIGICSLLYILITFLPIHNRRTRIHFPVLSGFCSRFSVSGNTGIRDPTEN